MREETIPKNDGSGVRGALLSHLGIRGRSSYAKLRKYLSELFDFTVCFLGRNARGGGLERNVNKTSSQKENRKRN